MWGKNIFVNRYVSWCPIASPSAGRLRSISCYNKLIGKEANLLVCRTLSLVQAPGGLPLISGLLNFKLVHVLLRDISRRGLSTCLLDVIALHFIAIFSLLNFINVMYIMSCNRQVHQVCADV